MNCHICRQPATFQCRFCWAFYCPEHQAGLDHPCTSGFWSRSQRLGIAFSAGTDFEEVRKKFEEAQAQPDPAFRGMQLKRVIPVVQSQTIGKTEVTITAVEEFEDGFVVY